jgi:Protein of unknown function (DUF5818)
MKKTLLVFAVSAIACFAGEWTGHVSDSKCGAAHADHSEKSINCVKGCVKGGEAPVFVTADGKVVKISNPDKVMAHLGHQVKVTGDLDGETLTVEGVEHVAP